MQVKYLDASFNIRMLIISMELMILDFLMKKDIIKYAGFQRGFRKLNERFGYVFEKLYLSEFKVLL